MNLGARSRCSSLRPGDSLAVARPCSLGRTRLCGSLLRHASRRRSTILRRNTRLLIPATLRTSPAQPLPTNRAPLRPCAAPLPRGPPRPLGKPRAAPTPPSLAPAAAAPEEGSDEGKGWSYRRDDITHAVTANRIQLRLETSELLSRRSRVGGARSGRGLLVVLAVDRGAKPLPSLPRRRRILLQWRVRRRGGGRRKA